MGATIQSYTDLTDEQKLQRTAQQFLNGFNREMIARHLAKKKKDGTPTRAADEHKQIFREHLKKELLRDHSNTAGFDAVYNKTAEELDQRVDRIASEVLPK
jgi:hypothetical protein